MRQKQHLQLQETTKVTIAPKKSADRISKNIKSISKEVPELVIQFNYTDLAATYPKAIM